MTNARESILALSILLLMSIPCQAAQRTFVSAGSGNDSNPCSRQLPCRNFAAAITQTDIDGEVVVLDSGGYGTVTINQSVSLMAPDGVVAGVTAFSGNAITVAISGTDRVILRGLSLNGLGGNIGIHFSAGRALRVENFVIRNFLQTGIRSEGSDIVIRNSTITGNRQFASNGILLVASTGTIDGAIENTSVDSALECVFASTGARVTATRVLASDCSLRGFRAVGTGAELTVESSAAVNSSEGVLAGCNSGIVRISNSTFTNNDKGVRNCTATIFSRGNNTIAGNSIMDVDGTLTPLGGQ